jgi:hypothetical protein
MTIERGPMPSKPGDILSQVGASLRAEEEEHTGALDPRLERLALGQLTPAELVALERDAAADPELAAKVALFRPMEPPAHARVRGAALGALGVPAAVSAPPKAASPAARPRRRGLVVAGLSAPVVAAAAALWLLVGARGELPVYESVVRTAEVQQRSATAVAPSVVQSGRDFEMVARPDRATSAPVAARAFVGREGAFAPWRGAIDVSKDGAVRLTGAASAVFAAPGDFEIAVAIGPDGSLPQGPGDVASLVESGRAPSRFRLVLQPVRYAPAP